MTVVVSLLALCGGVVMRAQATRRPYAAIAYGGNYLHNYLIPPAPSATPFAPAWSPDGRTVAFSLHGSIWTIDSTGGRAREVVRGPRYYSSPVWSPDGRWLVYTADDGGRTIELERLDVAAGTTMALTTDGKAYLDPVFSPDGTRLAYAASLPGGFLNVFVRPIRNGGWAGPAVAVTEDSTTPIATERPYFTAQDMYTAPAWIDDRELLLVSNHGVALGSGAIVRVPAAPLGIRQAKVVVDEQTLYHARPVASPDGRRLAYISADAGKRARHRLVFRALDDSRASAQHSDTPARSGDIGVIDARETATPSASKGGEGVTSSVAFDLFRPRWSPDGKRLVGVSNAGGVPELAIVDAATGVVRPLPLAGLDWREKPVRLAVTVRDASTGAVVPARVHLTGADGRFYAPDGAYARTSWAGDRLFHTVGRFDVDVPSGTTRLEVVRGFELLPAKVEVTGAAGERREVEVKLTRLDDPAARGWHGGSTGAHMQAGGLMLERLDSLIRMAEAEAVPFLSSPVAHRPHDLTERDFWIAGGAAHATSSRAAQLVLGQEHRPPFFGHVMGFGLRGWLDTLVPVTIGYEAPAGQSLARTNTDMLREMRARGGITSYVHAFAGEQDPMQAGLGIGKAFLVDAALGLVDTLEWAAASRGSFVPWYAALNNGMRVAAIGGEDSITNLHISRLVGCVRTYVFLDREPLTPAAWWNAAKEGRSFVTTGPLVELRAGGQLPGGEVALAGAGPVDVSVRVRSITPLQRVQLIVNGRPVQDVPLDASRTQVDWQGQVAIDRSGWMHLRAEGLPAERGPLDALYAQAFTNPIWLSMGGRPVRDRVSAEYGLQWIDRLQIMADAWPGWSSTGERAHVFGQFDEARRVYRQLAQEAGDERTVQGAQR